MSSGKYSAISGAVSRMENMNRITEKLAAVKTPGFKQGNSTFEAKLGEINSGMATEAINYTQISKAEIDYSQGPLEFSGDPLDLAINGKGFFHIKLPDDTTAYERKGNFQLDADSRLVDTSGYPVLDVEGEEIILPQADVIINTDGRIWDGENLVAQIAVMAFEDESILMPIRGELYTPTDDSEPALTTDMEILQKNLEGSNVNLVKTMTMMTDNLRAFEATQKALKIYSDMDAKATDIGTIQ